MWVECKTVLCCYSRDMLPSVEVTIFACTPNRWQIPPPKKMLEHDTRTGGCGFHISVKDPIICFYYLAPRSAGLGCLRSWHLPSPWRLTEQLSHSAAASTESKYFATRHEASSAGIRKRRQPTTFLPVSVHHFLSLIPKIVTAGAFRKRTIHREQNNQKQRRRTYISVYQMQSN